MSVFGSIDRFRCKRCKRVIDQATLEKRASARDAGGLPVAVPCPHCGVSLSIEADG